MDLKRDPTLACARVDALTPETPHSQRPPLLKILAVSHSESKRRRQAAGRTHRSELKFRKSFAKTAFFTGRKGRLGALRAVVVNGSCYFGGTFLRAGSDVEKRCPVWRVGGVVPV